MSKRTQFSLLAIILGALALALTLSATDMLHVGSGFGRESKFVINTQNVEIFQDYLNGLERRGIETEFVEISDYEFEIMFSALENVDALKSEIVKVIPDVTFKYEGNFGNIGTYINNQGFIRTYLVLLVFFVCIYFGVRFRFWGSVTAIQMALAYAVSLSLIALLNLPFTEMLWYAIVLSLIIASLSKQSFLKNFEGTYPSALATEGFQIIKRPLHVYLLNILFGFIVMNTSLVPGQASGLFIMIFSFVLLASDLVISWLLTNLIDAFAFEDNDNLKFVDSWRFGSDINVYESLKRFIPAVVAFLALVLMVVPTKVKLNLQGQDFDSKRVLIVSDSNAKSYLEVEAMLHSIGLFDKQVSYSTSDQNQLWIYFQPSVSDSDLKIARNIISSSLGIDTAFYLTRQREFPSQSNEFYLAISTLLGLTLIAMVLLLERKDAYRLSVLALISTVMLILILFVLAPEWKREYVLMIYSMPIVIANAYSTPLHALKLNDGKVFYDAYLNEFMSLSALVLIVSALILIIVPIQNGIDLIESFVFFTVTFELSRLVYRLVLRGFRKYVKLYDDESY